MTDNWQFKSGAKPSWVSQSDWERLLERPVCARLSRGDCVKPCSLEEDGSYACSVDHVVARASGGPNDFANLQWLCACENSRKGARSDGYWRNQFWFDRRPVLENLRQSQVEAAWEVVVDTHRDAFADAPASLLDTFLLMAWVVGSGKTIGAMTALMAINFVRSAKWGATKRVSRALFLVHQRTLVESIAQELRDDLTGYGVVDVAPRVLTISEAGDWPRVAAGNFDIAVACTQSIWDVSGRVLDEAALAKQLGKFDAIVVDEGHFAIERYAQIMALAPLAWKFAMTATPFDTNGRFFCDEDAFGTLANIFALFSVYDYDKARSTQPPSLKELHPFDFGIGSGHYVPFEGGESVELFAGQERDGAVNSRVMDNFPRQKALVAEAIRAIESDKTPFDGHLLVKADNIKIADALTRAINHDESGIASDRGWRATAVYTGSTGTRLSESNHPWNLVKANGKRRTRSARILVTVDIGQFGLNNKYCSAICWVAESTSMIELVQRIGRGLRYAKGAAPVRLLWDGKFNGMTARMSDAVEYIRTMRQRILNAGFRSIAQAIERGSDAIIDPIDNPHLTNDDRVRMLTGLGAEVLRSPGASHDEIVSRAVDEWVKRTPPPVSAVKLSTAQRFAEEIVGSDAARRRSIGLPRGDLVSQPLVINEEPKLPTREELLRAIETGGLSVGAMTTKDMYEAVMEGGRSMKILQERKREIDRQYFVPPSIDVSFVNEIRSVAKEVLDRFCIRGDGEIYGLAYATASTVAAWYFGFPNIRKGTIERHEPYLVHAARNDRRRQDLRGMFFGYFLHVLGKKRPELHRELRAIYSVEIDAVVRSLGGEHEACA